jgi:hypothetical protein
LAGENEDIVSCEEAALAGAMMLDKLEEEDARHQQR